MVIETKRKRLHSLTQKLPQRLPQRLPQKLTQGRTQRKICQFVSIFSGVSLGFVLSSGSAIAPAFAQAAYGSYVGVGGSLGLTDGGPGEGRSAAGVVAARYDILEAPVSIRAQAFFGDRTAIVPTVSYDIPLNWYTDAYIGAGVALQGGGDPENTSPIGNQTAFVIQPGIDHVIPDSNIVVFGNAVIAFDAYREQSGTAAAIQGGVGLRF